MKEYTFEYTKQGIVVFPIKCLGILLRGLNKHKVMLIFFVLILLCLTSCENTCQEYADNFKNYYEFQLKLLKKDSRYRVAYLTGIDIKSKKIITYRDESGFTAHHLEKFQIGDTLVKKEGKYQIVIIRKGKRIVIPYNCGERDFQN